MWIFYILFSISPSFTAFLYRDLNSRLCIHTNENKIHTNFIQLLNFIYYVHYLILESKYKRSKIVSKSYQSFFIVEYFLRAPRARSSCHCRLAWIDDRPFSVHFISQSAVWSPGTVKKVSIRQIKPTNRTCDMTDC